MSIAGIEKVREAEAAADKARKSADEEAAAILASGKKEAKAILDKAEKEADADYKATIAKAETEAADLYQSRIDKEKLACEKIKSDARGNLDAAVEKIIGKVVDVYGNS